VIPFIDQILQGDLQAPRKQRHTAYRIWARRREERPDCPVAERTCTIGSLPWGCWRGKCAWPRATTGAWKRRWIGMRLMPIWAANARSCMCLHCAAWRVGRHSTVLSRTPHSRPSWKLTSWPLPGLAGSFID
jgi:hypothetical protein